MKWSWILFFSFLPTISFGQSVFTSSYTQTWPTIFNSKVEKINHSISFEENSISLATEKRSGKEIETFYIREIQQKNGATEYFCLTRDNRKLTVIKPLRKLKYIDIYRPSARTGEEVQLRLHLNE